MSTSSASSLGIGNIAGIAVGGFLAIVTVIAIIISCYSLFCNKKKSPQVGAQPPQYYQQYGPYGQQMNTGYYPQQPYQYPQQQQQS